MMMSRALALVLFVFAIAAPACKDSGDSAVNSPYPDRVPSSYDYRAHTAGGTLAVIGTITLQKTDSIQVTGTWALEGVSDVNRVGPQLGAGTLTGRLEGSSISLNLNPGWADNNVILLGTVGSDRISGTWTWVTFAGPTTSGNFEAVRKK